MRWTKVLRAVHEDPYPNIPRYRETWKEAPWVKREGLAAKWGFRAFWTYWWYMLFKNPYAMVGHDTIPDASQWSNEELGIPPDSVGSYRDWLEAKLDGDH